MSRARRSGMPYSCRAGSHMRAAGVQQAGGSVGQLHSERQGSGSRHLPRHASGGGTEVGCQRGLPCSASGSFLWPRTTGRQSQKATRHLRVQRPLLKSEVRRGSPGVVAHLLAGGQAVLAMTALTAVECSEHGACSLQAVLSPSAAPAPSKEHT